MARVERQGVGGPSGKSWVGSGNRKPTELKRFNTLTGNGANEGERGRGGIQKQGEYRRYLYIRVCAEMRTGARTWVRVCDECAHHHTIMRVARGQDAGPVYLALNRE